MNKDREDSSLQQEDDFAEEAEGLAGETSDDPGNGAAPPGSRSQDSELAALEVELEEKEAALTKAQDENTQLFKKLQDQDKKLAKFIRDVERLNAEMEALRKQWIDEQFKRQEAEKKLTASEHNLRKMTESLSFQERKLKTEQQESTRRINGMVDELEGLDPKEGVAKRDPDPVHGPRLRRQYYGTAHSPVSHGFKSQAMIPLHLDIDPRDVEMKNFPLLCEGRVFAKNIATLDKREILVIRQFISKPLPQHWDLRMSSLKGGIYRVEGYLSYSKEGKPLFEPTLLNLGVVTIVP